jgi:hypothetical protein
MMRAMTGTSLSDPTPSSKPPGMYTIAVNGGLDKTINDPVTGNPIWVVRPDDFEFSATTAFPATEVDIAPSPGEGSSVDTKFPASSVAPDGDNYFVCIRPMKTTLSAALLTITLTDTLQGVVYDLAGKFDFSMALQQVPAAKWGRPVSNEQNPEMNTMLDGRLVGMENITPLLPTLTPLGAMALSIDITEAFTFITVDEGNDDQLPLVAGISPGGIVPQVDSGAVGKIQSLLMSDTTVLSRSSIFNALQNIGISAGVDGSLSVLAANPAAVLTGNPFII